MRILRLSLPLLFALSACSGGDDDSGDDLPRDAGTVTNTDAGDDPPRDGGESATDAGEADGGTTIDPAEFPRIDCDDVSGPCVQVPASDVGLLLDTVNATEDNLTIIVGTGTVALENAVTIRGSSGITFTGQGIDVTILDFSGQAAQSNGVDVVGDDFTISHLTIDNAKKDGLRVEDSTNVEIRHLKATWSGGPATSNGAYGIYPVKCVNVLIEDSEAHNAADAGIYVGQSINAVVRRNVATGNVAGIEIENTQYADVYENVVEDNSGGLLIFDLPGNPIVGHSVRIHHNTIRRNNRRNFAASGTTVSQIPAGTGTFALASRRVEIDNNTYEQNDTVDIAILSGLAIGTTPDDWNIPHEDRVGSIAGLKLPMDEARIQNFGSGQIMIHDNSHTGSGSSPDVEDPGARPIGALLALLYRPPGGPATDVDEILYDGIGELVVPGDAAMNTNNNHVCVQNVGDATYATLDLPALQATIDGGGFPTLADIYRPAAPFAPFDCNALDAGPLPSVELGLFEDDSTDFPRRSCADVTGTCVQFSEGEENGFLDAINTLTNDTTVILGRGTFIFDNAVTIRAANGITLAGQGKDVSVLDFGTQTAQSNGIDVVGDDFTLHDLTILDAKKDGLRVEDSNNVVIRRVKVTWSNGPAVENGAYGIYPVKCRNVLLEESEAYNASDAGLYVGQTIGAIVRHNVAASNVAGLEIENTQFADVYGNDVQDNAGGLLIFDLPRNPIVGRDVRMYRNYVGSNNRANFAQSMTTVSQIPAGTGTFALASRRVAMFDNTYFDNQTTDIAFISGLAVQGSTTAWAIPRVDLVGSIEGLNLLGDNDFVLNFRTEEIDVRDNITARSGRAPDAADAAARPIGALLSVVYFATANGPVDNILYDGIGEAVDPTTPGNNTNINHVCVGANNAMTYATLDLANLDAIISGGGIPTQSDIYQPAPPFAPFDCDGFTAGPISEVVLPLQ